MISEFRKRPEFQRGRAGEKTVANWLMKRGWYVIPSYDYSGEDGNKPPRLMGVRNNHPDHYPVPDLDIAKDGTRRWVEVKTKKEPSPGRISGKPEHGFEHYDDYLRVAAETGCEVWIAIYEESTRQLLVQSLSLLGPPRRNTYNGRKMAYFTRDCFRVLHTFTEEELTNGGD